jgi:ectoine hydroxylase-related dioxygenase (phytanoyl-CoA dioxygenase family)
MRRFFSDDEHEASFKRYGYLTVALLNDDAITDLAALYDAAFRCPRRVVAYARNLPYYISVFDEDAAHKREVDARISARVEPRLRDLLVSYEVFYSNFMVKFPGDGEIEAHQDLNFVDESVHSAFNMWCPLTDTDLRNGGLCVIPGSHKVFRTQRGPNLPKALTEYNELLKRHAQLVPLKKGQAIIFDHRLVHCSPPNRTTRARVAIQSVLKPTEAPAIHYVFDPRSRRVNAYRIDKNFVLENNLWDTKFDERRFDHAQELIPFPTKAEMMARLAGLRLHREGTRAVETMTRIARSLLQG